MPNPVITKAIDRLMSRQDLSVEDISAVLAEIMDGNASEVETAGVLVALRTKGETEEEIEGLARTMRRFATPVDAGRDDLVDTAGTGGGRPTFNVSTTAALIAAGAGCAVAKHGNRSATGLSGSADLLEALGVRIDLEPDAVAQCIREVGFGFMFAPAHHSATRYVIPVRKELAVRTIFNFLGPLTNPAGATRQVIGVSDPAFLETIAGALARLGAERALVVSSADGLDELSTSAPTRVVEVDGGGLRTLRGHAGGRRPAPQRAGRRSAPGPPEANAATTRRILAGEPGPERDLALLNAGAAIYAGGRADTPAGGRGGGRRGRRLRGRRGGARRADRHDRHTVAWMNAAAHERPGPHRRRHARRGRAPPRARAAGPARARARRPPGGSGRSRRRSTRPGVSLIAEHKRRSPSAGVIREGATVTEIVQAYERGCAAALSILTEPFHFGGSLDDLREALAATDLPILRKDFIVDPYQLYESAAVGADAILLIVAALDPDDLYDLLREARDLDLDALVEVHDERELDVALDVEADVLGLNNRDLTDFSVDIERTYELLADVPAGKTVVAESGYSSRDQLDELERVGVDAVLIGETLMRAPDVEAACVELTGGTEHDRESDGGPGSLGFT